MPISNLKDTLGLKTDLPLVLFPVRLETRFNYVDNGKELKELLVRIYPDTVHMDSFEPELTEAEIKWGRNFWIHTWLAGNDEARQCSAWAQLAEHFGVARAAWIARKLEPNNPGDQPKKPIQVTDNSRPPESYLPIQPSFPNPATHPEAWTRAAYTQILPEKWIVLIYENESSDPLIFEGDQITLPLDVSISPKKDGGLDAKTLKDNDNIGWLVDFDKAKKKGMGLSISNPPKNIKRLVVLGVNTALNGQEGRDKLEELIQAHHHTQGISFLRQGTPTNNTDDAPSGYSTLDPGFKNSFDVERKANPTLIENSNRTVTAKALGVDDKIFTHVRDATTVEQLDARAMNTVLWQATWGYFLEQMMAGPDAPSEQTLRQARSHFERYVRARGPLPALRIGEQPYGILPVISLKHWESESEDAPLAAFLKNVREVWKNSLARVPNVPGIPNVPEEFGITNDLNSLLNYAPVSVNYHRRPAQRIALRSSTPDSKTFETGNQTAKDRLKGFGLNWTPRQIRMVLGNYNSPQRWQGAIIADASDEPKAIEILQKYCLGLMNDPFAEIQQRTLSSTNDSLFYWLLREACLREYLVAAFRLLKLPAAERLEPEYEDGGISAIWQVLERTAPNLNPTKVVDYLDTYKKNLINQIIKQKLEAAKIFEVPKIPGVTTEIAAELNDFAAFFASLHYLSQQPIDKLDGLFRETLDLCSHRYDAWVTSLAAKRLEVSRGKNPQGAYLGGYGWVEDLRPDSTTDKSHGFIHAPSLAHATTAALLRSGYVSHDEQDRETFAVNLSSQRIRTALWLLDGVRQGQSLSALLGYRFERGLHENHLKDVGISLDHYIPFFRQIAPLAVDELPSMTPERISALPASQVVDGLALLRNWQSMGRVIPWEKYSSSTIPVLPDHKKACQEELERLEDAVDAISDLVIAESVHQVAQGNPVRAGATLSAIAEGEAPPPELDVIRTPRSGIGITHRIAVVFDGLPKGAVWGAQTARARAEPFLNTWAVQLFGPQAAKAVCQVEYLSSDPADKSKTIVLGQKTITLDQLGLAPIDMLYLPESEGDAQRSELEQRVIYLAQRALPAGVSSAAEIKLTFNRDSSDGVMSFAEVLEVARAARKMITSARALQPRDLAQPGQATPAETENDPVLPGESADAPLALSERAEAAIKAFKKAFNSLTADLPEDDAAPIDVEGIREKLMLLSEFGLPAAIPLAPIGDTVEVQNVLRSQAQSIVIEASKRLDRLDTLTQAHEQLKREERTSIVLRDYYVARLHEVFGQDFRVLPRFNPANTENLRETFAASKELQNNNPFESVTWFQRIARVRDGAARLDAVLMYAEAIGGSKLGFTVGQLPYDKEKEVERWVALEGDIAGSRLSLVVHAPSRLNLSNPVAGLLIDEWVEVVPNKEEITGLTFYYNAPQSRAPQAILLAIAPDNKDEWSLEMLTDTLLETLELSKLRMVDLTCLLDTKLDPSKFDPDSICKINASALSDVGQFLPALYFPTDRAPEWHEKTS